MKIGIAVDALNNASSKRGNVTGRVVHSVIEKAYFEPGNSLKPWSIEE